jgi:hypothetical protein
MKLKKVRTRVDTSALGLEETEYDKIEKATQEDGSIDLAQVYDIPSSDGFNNKYQRTVDSMMERKGLSDEEAYAKEYQLRVAHQVLINGGSTQKIAELLNISLSKARGLKNELNARLIKEARSLNKDKVVGQSLMFYDSIQAKFLQMSQGDSTQGPGAQVNSLRSRIEALKGALQAQSDKNKFLKDVGFFREPLNTSEEADVRSDDANTLRDMAQLIISGEDFEIDNSDDDTDDDVELL